MTPARLRQLQTDAWLRPGDEAFGRFTANPRSPDYRPGRWSVTVDGRPLEWVFWCDTARGVAVCGRTDGRGGLVVDKARRRPRVRAYHGRVRVFRL